MFICTNSLFIIINKSLTLMNINLFFKNIKFILSQNFKNQKFKKEYNVKFDPEVNNFIKTYFSKIPKELDINRNLDLLSNISFEDRLRNYNLIKIF